MHSRWDRFAEVTERQKDQYDSAIDHPYKDPWESQEEGHCRMASPLSQRKINDNTLANYNSIALQFEDWVEKEKIDEHPADESLSNISGEAVQAAPNEYQYLQAQPAEEVSDQTVNTSSNQINFQIFTDTERQEKYLSSSWNNSQNVACHPHFAQEVENRQKHIDPERYVLPKELVPNVEEGIFYDAPEHEALGPDDVRRYIADGEFDELLLHMYPNVEDAQNGNAPVFDPLASVQLVSGIFQQQNQYPPNQRMLGLTSSRMELNSNIARSEILGFESHRKSLAKPNPIPAISQVAASSLELQVRDGPNHAVDNEKFILACRKHVQSMVSLCNSSPQDVPVALPNESPISDEVKEWLDYNIIKARKASELKAHNKLSGAIKMQTEVVDYDQQNSKTTHEDEESDDIRCLTDAETLFSGFRRYGNSQNEEFASPSPSFSQSDREWCDGYPFPITWEEFEAELESFDLGGEKSVKIDKDGVRNPSGDVVIRGPANKSDMSIDDHSVNEAEAFHQQKIPAGCELHVNSSGTPHNDSTNQESTPANNWSALGSSELARSATSFKTSEEDLNNSMDLDTDDEISLIRTSPVRLPKVTAKRVFKPLKSTYVKSALKEKSTKNIFAVVESRNEEQGGEHFHSPKAESSWNWGDASHLTVGRSIHAGSAPTNHSQPRNIAVRIGSPVPRQSPAVSSSFPTSPPCLHPSRALSQASPTTSQSLISTSFCTVPPTVNQFPQVLPDNILIGPVAAANYFPLRGRGQGPNGGRDGRQDPVRFPHGNSTRGGYRSRYSIDNPKINPNMVPFASPTAGNNLSPASQYLVSNSPELPQGKCFEDVSATQHTGVHWRTKPQQIPSVSSPLQNFRRNKMFVGKPTHARRSSENLGESMDSTPLKINFPPSYASRGTSRETLTITFKNHAVRQAAVKTLEDAAQAVDESFTIAEDFSANTTKIVMSGPAGKNMRGFVKKHVPYGKIDIAMAF